MTQMPSQRTTLLAIGDSCDFDSFKKLDKEKRFIHSIGFDYRAIDYKTLFELKQLDIFTQKVIVLTYFPFYYWNKHIECRNYKGLYGNLIFLKKFEKFSKMLVRRVQKLLPDREIDFINDPRRTCSYRDKAAIMQRLDQKGISVPPMVKVRQVAEICRLLDSGKKIYIKPRCGSMGKGITYLAKDTWQTNFKLKGQKIIQCCSDYGWKFREVTGRKRFLKSLLQGDFMLEEAVSSFKIKDKKIDFRVYACRDKVLYIYPRKNSCDSVTTNISQGGKGSPAILKRIPDSVLKRIKKQVRRTMLILELDFAGIDVILDEDMRNIYVVDINLFAGFPKRRTYNLARDFVTQLKKRK